MHTIALPLDAACSSGRRNPTRLAASSRLPVRWVRWDEQARRPRPAGASAAPVILAVVRRAGVLIGATALLALGCGGNDRATARPSSSATPSPTATASPTAVAAKPGLRLKRIGSFDNPVYVTAPPGDRKRIFVVEQGGRVWIVRGGKRLARPFLNISGSISSGGERG